jgi:UDP:flavonoid glycosyltransferase YjiC (YdhE family)
MNKNKRIVLSTFGSFGDIHPYMSLALELQDRGHRPVIATMGYYKEKIEQAGLSFQPVRPNIPVPQAQDTEFIKKIMEPKTGPRFLMQDVIFPAVRDCYADLMEVVQGADLLITHPAAPAGPLVGRKTGIPWISTVLAPMSFFSAYDPPVPPFWPWMMDVIKKLGPGATGALLNLMKNSYRAKSVDQFREELGIPDYGNPIGDGQHSPHLVLALFSPVFAAPQRDWPRQAHATGFCFYD